MKNEGMLFSLLIMVQIYGIADYICRNSLTNHHCKKHWYKHTTPGMGNSLDKGPNLALNIDQGADITDNLQYVNDAKYVMCACWLLTTSAYCDEMYFNEHSSILCA